METFWNFIVGTGALSGLGFLIKEVVSFFKTKSINTHKAKNEQINHITKIQFDAEFKIYQDLSESSFDLADSTYKLFVYVDYLPQEKEKILELYKERYKKAQENYNIFTKTLIKSAPFISKVLYTSFEKLRQDCNTQLHWYPLYYIEPNEARSSSSSWINKEEELKDNNSKIKSLHEKIIEELRDHLNSLKVI